MTRSIKKGPYVASCLAKKLKQVKSSGKKEVLKTWKRASMITPDFVGITFAVHDGKKFQSVFVTEDMVGHALGEFAPTRTFRMHSGQRQSGAASAAKTPAPASAPVAAAAKAPAAKAPAKKK